MVLEAWHLRSRCQQDEFLLRVVRITSARPRASFLLSCHPSLVFLGLWEHPYFCPRGHIMFFLCISISRAPSHTTLIPTLIISTRWPLSRPYLQVRSHSEVRGVRASTCDSGGDTIQPTTVLLENAFVFDRCYGLKSEDCEEMLYL